MIFSENRCPLFGIMLWVSMARGRTGSCRADKVSGNFSGRRGRAAARGGDAPGPAHHPHLAARSAAAEEPVAAVGLESRNGDAGRHLEPLQHRPATRIDPSPVAGVAFPAAGPELAVDPGDPGDEAGARDGAQDRPGLRIDLVDLSVRILPHPERAFGPGEP